MSNRRDSVLTQSSVMSATASVTTLTISAGQTVVRSGVISGGVSIAATGTLAVAAKSTLTSFGSLVGPASGAAVGVVNIGAGALLFEAGSVSATIAFRFTANSGTLELAGQDLALMAGGISGWTAGDVVDIASMRVTSAVVQNGGASLLLQDDGQIIGTLALRGFTAGQNVIAVPDGIDGTRLLLSALLAPAMPLASSGQQAPRAFAWRGGTGNWADAVRWSMTGSPGPLAPGSLDSAAIVGPSSSFISVTGAAAASAVTTAGSVRLGGNFTLGSLTLNTSALLVVSAGADIEAGSVAMNGSATMEATGTGAVVNDAGSWAVGSGLLQVDDGGSISAQAMILAGGTLAVDSAGGIILGGAVGQPGAIVIGSTSALSGYGTLRADVAVAGTLTASGGVLGIFGAVSASGTMAIAGGATLYLAGTVAASATLAFADAASVATLELFAPASCAATIAGVAFGDVIDLAGITLGPPTWQPPGPGGGGIGTLDLGQYGTLAIRLDPAIDPTQTSFAISADGFDGTMLTLVPCFTPGTLIETDRGPRAIERLRVGDRVVTRAGACKPIVWVGERHYHAAFVARERQLRPVRFAAGALGGGRPGRSLTISPQHGLWLPTRQGPRLVPAAALVDGDRIDRVGISADVTYMHIALRDHDAIWAEGVAAETFLPGSDDHVHLLASCTGQLPPGMAARWDRVETGPALAALRQRMSIGEHGRARHIPRSTTRHGIHGTLDGACLDNGWLTVEGWARLQDPDANTSLVIELSLEGRVLGQTIANGWRPDLDRAGLGDGNCAFTAKLPWRAEHLVSRLSARVVWT